MPKKLIIDFQWEPVGEKVSTQLMCPREKKE